VAVITNIEADHLDIYGDLEGVRTGFRNFLKGMRDGGRVAACADDLGAASMLAEVGAAGYSYGLSAGCCLRAVDVEVESGSMSCRIREDGRDVGALTVASGGVHNLRNALGAASAARAMGAEWDAIRSAMATFGGVVRRFDRLGEARGVVVVDDYAHHPTEIEATLAAARASFPRARLVAAFQPHLFSRTRDFHEAFGNALAAADVVWVTDVFPARERPVPGITGAMVAQAAERAGAADVRYHPLLDGLPAVLAETLEVGDVLLTLGAGSVERVGGEVLRLLEGQTHA
jgi:UDP-N-acetylmuramate--alanine ligase